MIFPELYRQQNCLLEFRTRSQRTTTVLGTVGENPNQMKIAYIAGRKELESGEPKEPQKAARRVS